MTEFSCPSCGSEYTRSYKAIAESGTSSGTTTVEVSDFAMRTSYGDATIVVTTEEARIAAKPNPAYSGFKAIGGFCILMALMTGAIGALSSFLEISSLGSGFLVVGTGVAIIGAVLYGIGGMIDASKDTDLEKRIETWGRMWRCSRCGNSFELNASTVRTDSK